MRVSRATAGQAALLAIAFTYAIGAEITRLGAAWPIEWVVADLLPGLAFFIAGVLAWRRRPGNAIGPLLFAIGVSWFPGTWTASENPAIGLLGYTFQGYFNPLLAWLVFAYPTGRLTSRAERLAVTGFLAALVARSVFRVVAFQGLRNYDLSIPTEADRYIADTTFRQTGEQIFAIGITAIAAVVLILIARRLLRARGAGRRIAGPVLIGGVAVAIGILVQFAAGFVKPTTLDERHFFADFGLYLTSLTGAVVAAAFLLGVARARIARGTVADLVVELGDPERTPSLRDLLAKALRDPTLEVVYAVPGGGFVGADGHAVEMPEPTASDRGVTRLEHGGRTIAALIHDPALAEEKPLVTSVAAAARMALENERLQAEVRAQLDEVRASRARIVAAGDAERQRIERDLHDGAQQRLVTLALALQMASGKVGPADGDLRELLVRAGSELDAALSELRELARGVHPSIVVESGLGPAIEALADRATVPVDVHLKLERPCRSEAEVTAYFVISESLANVAKHARASGAEIRAEVQGMELRLSIRDDGAGGADASRGTGLGGLADRVAAVGGRLSIDSPPGGGTTVEAVIPCA